MSVWMKLLAAGLNLAIENFFKDYNRRFLMSSLQGRWTDSLLPEARLVFYRVIWRFCWIDRSSGCWMCWRGCVIDKRDISVEKFLIARTVDVLAGIMHRQFCIWKSSWKCACKGKGTGNERNLPYATQPSGFSYNNIVLRNLKQGVFTPGLIAAILPVLMTLISFSSAKYWADHDDPVLADLAGRLSAEICLLSNFRTGFPEDRIEGT